MRLPATAPMNPTDRAAARLRFAREALAEPGLRLSPASADASFRSYWRTCGGGPSLIVMDAPPEHENIGPWLEIAGRLRRAGLNAPQVLAVDREHGFVLMSDLGTRALLSALDADRVDALYGQVLDALFAIQSRVAASGLPDYDETRLVAEMELMPAWFLQRHIGFTPGCEQWDTIESTFRALLDNALAQPRVFVHRDFHSRNLMVCDPGPGILDFQDAVRGPITYDLVSVLRDCYIAWPEGRVYDWVEGYRRRLAEAGLVDVDGARFRQWFDLMGVQRHLKVLGIFSRLNYRDGKPGYLADLPRVWRYTRQVGLQYDATRPLVELLERAIGGADPGRCGTNG